MSHERLVGLKRLISGFHANRDRPGYARDLLTPHDRLGEFDAAYAALEADGEVVRAGSLTQLVTDEFGQRHRKPLFVSARSR